MEMTSTRTVPAPVAAVWAALNDPQVLKGCIPGCDAIEPDGENAYRIAARGARRAGRRRNSRGECSLPTSIRRVPTR